MKDFMVGVVVWLLTAVVILGFIFIGYGLGHQKGKIDQCEESGGVWVETTSFEGCVTNLPELEPLD